MAKYIRAVKLPELDLVAIDSITAVKHFDAGVGLLDLRNRMIGWVEIEVEDEEVRKEHFERVLTIFDNLINDRRRAQQPDWGFLKETKKTAPKPKSGAGSATVSN